MMEGETFSQNAAFPNAKAAEIEADACYSGARRFKMPRDAVAGFSGPNRFLSNFWFCNIRFEGVLYPSTEHAFQAAKTLSTAHRKSIAQACSAADAKRLGRRVSLRPDWDQVRTAVMLEINRQKYSQQILRRALLATQSRPIFEVTTRWNDQIWGVVQLPGGDYIGANRLGRILTCLRAEILMAQDDEGGWDAPV